MAVHPFGMWSVGDSFYQAVDLEDEEDDQYEENNENINTYQVKCSEMKVPADVLVVTIDTPANMFIDTYMDLPQPIGEVIKSNDENFSKGNKEKCVLYQMGQTILCQCKAHISPEDAHQWVHNVLTHIQPKTVVVLSSQTKSSFNGDFDAKNSDADILRCLKTSQVGSTDISVPLLEHGTVISDLPAALMSYCQMFDIPALMYTSFTESHFVDVFTLKTLETVLADPMLKNLPRLGKTVLAGKLRDFEGVGVADNNLYI